VTDATSTQAGAGAPWSIEAIDSFLNSRYKGMPVSRWAPLPGPEAIALTAGIPDPETLPREQLLEAVGRVLRSENAKWALEYGDNYGYEGLRELVASRVDVQPGLGYTAANVHLTGGAAQALQIVFDTFIDPGDTVVVEAPAWGGIIRWFRGFQARMEPVTLDEHGIVIAELEDLLARLTAEGRKPKMIYTIPTFQNPMGITATLERRKQLIEVAARHRVLILEDDPYGELRFGGQPVPSILSLSGGDGVIRTGSFSKTIATGLRLGWITGPKEYVDATAKMRFDNGTSPFMSYVVTAYVEAGYFEPHVARMREVYRSKCDVMLSALEESCSRFSTWTRPDGGFFIWLTLPAGTDQNALMQAADGEGIQYVPGMSFYPNGGGEQYVRLAYSYEPEPALAEAIRRLARAIEKASR
jgi:2-aminoadipate transaminase